MPRKIQPSLNAINTYVAGTTFRNDNGTSRQKIIDKYCHVGDEVNLIPEPNNKHDSNAIKVCLKNGKQIGYLRENVAEIRARKQASKSGATQRAFIDKVESMRNGSGLIVGIVIIEWNNAVSEEEANKFFEEERKEAIQFSNTIVRKKHSSKTFQEKPTLLNLIIGGFMIIGFVVVLIICAGILSINAH